MSQEMTWSAGELEVRVVPDGKEGPEMSFSVYPAFGYPKTRLVQGIAKKLKSHACYFYGRTPDGKTRTAAVPVAVVSSAQVCGNGTDEGALRHVADYLSNLNARGYDLVVRSRGKEYAVLVTPKDRKSDSLSDTATSELASPRSGGGFSRRGIREEF